MFTRLSSGLRSCALDADGRAVCWGDTEASGEPPDELFEDLSIEGGGFYGILSGGALFGSIFSTMPPAGEFVAVTDGRRFITSFACALARDGSVTCRGLGPAASSPCGRFVEISAGDAHACGVRPDGSITCWGDDSFGQASPPVGTFRQISAGSEHTCALGEDGSIACWGAPERTATPSGKYIQVSAGIAHSCALRADEKVVCWGGDDDFQIDPPSDIAIEDETFTGIATGGASRADNDIGDPEEFVASACGFRTDGSIDCFGGGGSPPDGEFVALAVGSRVGCALDQVGTLSCWPMAARYGLPLPPESLLSETFSAVSIGNELACAIKSDGALVCWDDGVNIGGAPPSGVFAAVSVSGSRYLPGQGTDAKYDMQHACALRVDGAVLCWDYVRATGRQVDGPFVEVAAGYNEDCARRDDGTVACWAANATSAVEPLAGSFLEIGAGNRFQGLRTDGTVVAIDAAGVESVPVEGTFVDISVAGDFACGLRADRHVRCWGSRVR
jgi:hypothetical protein